jgi:4-oxalomesaconate hydratase
MKNRKKLNILVIGAHPADAFDNSGGTCLHHVRQGDSVTAAVITHGGRLHDEVISDAMRRSDKIPQGRELEAIIQQRTDIKRQEVRQACAIMGIEDVRFINTDDYVLLVNQKLIKDLARLIREVRPDIMITHYPFDNGGFADQHATVGKSAVHASWVANTVDPEDENPQHRIAQVYFMGFPSHFIKSSALFNEFSGHCHVYIDVSDVAHLKAKALDKMQSQQYGGEYALKRLESVEGGAGAAVKVSYAEPFIVAYSEVYQTLPVSDFRLETANETEKECRDRLCFTISKHGDYESYKAGLKEQSR